MDLLLQAARVLELENSGDGADRVSSKSTRETYFHQHTKVKTEIIERTHGGGPQFDHDNGVSTDDDIPLLERTSRRVGGVGTREVHNQLEKNRRKQLREFFTHLQQCVPSLENKRVATQSILQGAIKHIKNLKKKDVEQEREIQMLANRKSELKKKFDLELNKCSDEQPHMSDVLLKVIRSNINVDTGEQCGHTTDSTSTASEGPCTEEDNSDEDTDAVQETLRINTTAQNSEVCRRKLISRTVSADGVRLNELSSSSSRSGVCTRSLVSSSSVALKHMLEQRKRNQTVTCQASAGQQVSTVTTAGMQLPTLTTGDLQVPTLPTGALPVATPSARGAGSLTYSYPMISIHLSSSIKPSLSMSDHELAQPSLSMSGHERTQPSLSMSDIELAQKNMISQSSIATVVSTAFSTNSSYTPVMSQTESIMNSSVTRQNKKTVGIRSKGNNSNSQHMLSTQNPASTSQMIMMTHMPAYFTSQSPLEVTQASILNHSGNTLTQPSAMTVTTQVRQIDHCLTMLPKTVASFSELDVHNSNFSTTGTQLNHFAIETANSSNYLGKVLLGNQVFSSNSSTSITQPLDRKPLDRKPLDRKPLDDRTISSSRMIPSIIPFSLASIIQGLPTSGLPHVVTLSSSPLSLSSSTGGSHPTTSMDAAASSIFNQRLHLSQSTNYLLKETPVITEHNSLSSTNARMATLLTSPSTHINNSIIKPTSLNTTSTICHMASSMCPHSSYAIPVSLAPTLVPISLTSGPSATNTASPLSTGSPLHIFASLSQNAVIAAALASGQSSMLPTVVQLETSGQMALLHNLIPTQHVQNPHHILAQPMVVMATAGSDFGAASNTVITTSSSSTVL